MPSLIRRFLKDPLIRTYFHLRIDGTDDPYRIRWRSRPYRPLLILGHMRSGSSLLVHLLNSNPEILGYGETHITYTEAADFKQLLHRVYAHRHDYRMAQTYIFDKLLHDQKLANDDLLREPLTRAIFLLREPARSLASMLEIKSHWQASDALDYYTHRLQTLRHYADILGRDRSVLVEYEQLLSDSAAVFALLQNFLGTQAGFSEEYQVTHTTGMRGVGDSSANIKAGRIVRKERQLSRADEITAEQREQAERSYQHCRQYLQEHCHSLITEPPLSSAAPEA